MAGTLGLSRPVLFGKLRDIESYCLTLPELARLRYDDSACGLSASKTAYCSILNPYTGNIKPSILEIICRTEQNREHCASYLKKDAARGME